MKKTLLAFAAIVAALVSCQKEVAPTSVDEKDLEARDCFVASLDQSSKTILGDSLQVKWAADDSIIVNGVVYGLDFIYEDSDSTRAEFSKRYSDDETPKAPFTAFFPAKWYDKAQNDIVVPKTLTWQNNNDFSMPMKAVTSTRTMTFENTYGVLAVKVEKNVLAEALNTITVMTSETDTVRVLECSPAQTISEDGNIFYVPMAEGNYDSLIVYANSHEMFSRNNKDIEIKAGSLYAFNYKISLKSITLKEEDFQIIPGKDTTLKVTFDPENATNKAVIWTSTVDSVATVDSCGKLSAIKPGDTKIIVTSVEGAYKDSCTVTVKIPVDSVVLSSHALTINKTKDSTITAKVWPAEAGESATWSSTDETIASVDQNGKITANAKGTAKIIATSYDKADTCEVTVSVPVDSVVINPQALVLKYGADSALVAKVWPEDATNKNVTWSSLEETVATVDSATGRVTAVKEGNVQIVAEVEGKTDTCLVSVLPQGALTGLFSVSDSTKVRFSQGNLQATVDASGTPSEWNFATHQYDTVGNAVANTTIGSEAGVVDLFGWSTSSTNYGISTSKKTADYSGDFVDWGANPIANGGNKADVWRTLTSDEWTYLLNTRTVNGGTGEGKGYQRATVNSIYGLIIYPDSYTTQTTATSYTSAQWSTMESAGCVFLPAAGYRYGSSLYSVGSYGSYWSSTPYSSSTSRAYSLYFDSGSVNPADDYSRNYGQSVRLVYKARQVMCTSTTPFEDGGTIDQDWN